MYDMLHDDIPPLSETVGDDSRNGPLNHHRPGKGAGHGVPLVAQKVISSLIWESKERSHSTEKTRKSFFLFVTLIYLIYFRRLFHCFTFQLETFVGKAASSNHHDFKSTF